MTSSALPSGSSSGNNSREIVNTWERARDSFGCRKIFFIMQNYKTDRLSTDAIVSLFSISVRKNHLVPLVVPATSIVLLNRRDPPMAASACLPLDDMRAMC